jgi:hypothetical protein
MYLQFLVLWTLLHMTLPAVLTLFGSFAELAQQVGRVVRALSGAGLRVRSAVMTGGQSQADRRSKTFRTQVGGGSALVVHMSARSVVGEDSSANPHAACVCCSCW